MGFNSFALGENASTMRKNKINGIWFMFCFWIKMVILWNLLTFRADHVLHMIDASSKRRF